MSVGSVTSSSLQRDLLSALRQTRATSAQQTDGNPFAVASQATVASNAGAATASGSTASGPALSNDLMASLLQVQSDFSQINAQGGLAPPTSSTSVTEGSASDASSADGQDSGNPAPVHHHRGPHARPAGAASPDVTGSNPSGTDSTAAAAATGPSGGDANPLSGIEDGLQALLQQVTKAIAAYTTAGPVGLAASALSTSSKA
ncbi:cell wall anchor protein [Methylobacterium brachiatum]|uniref:cell wall anchor protein n=1 Tax=Methylobacterium brachiatum TaxID=269660 RepID=UPI002448165A|nr:cell wall anchor protein [Methylobacterium brachiatum]MDH2310947.1 cell wall anchor protein [Methylobacterium brachiatum]